MTHNSKQGWRKNKKKYYINRSNKKKMGTKRSGRFKISLPHWLNFKNVILVLSAIFLLAALSGVIFFLRLSAGIPTDPEQLIDRIQPENTKIFDRTGEKLLYEIHGNESRTFVPLEEIPEFVKQATIAIEDKDFYNHKGISLWGIFRGVVWRGITGKSIQGGSTLTQQFVKNAVLSNERTVIRKLKEWIISYRLEKKFSKDEILQMYFNEIPYGSTAYGVEAASQRYFGKNIQELNLPEAAILAALPQAPSRYSPYGSHVDLLIGRQHYILNLMKEQGFISEAKEDAAKQFELIFKTPNEKIIAPHFVMYVKELLTEKYGEKTVEQGGLRIITTLDLYKQEIAEEVITEHMEKNAEEWNASNTALVSLDPKTGQILTMVGSRDYFNDDIDGKVNVATRQRQPGSSMKPLVYAAAFTKGYTPNTVLYDVVTNFSNNPDEPYEPKNYDLKERGPVTIKKALAGSLNVPAVKAIYLAGKDNVLDIAEELGYSTLGDRERFGLSLVLGGGEVKLIEHTNAYSAFAREGEIHALAAILKVDDKDGNTLQEFEDNTNKVLDPKVARTINSILSDNEARAYAFGERNWLTLGSRPVAAKTGTTNDYRDAWTIGYTPSIVTGVWVGNNNNTKMKRGAAGGTVAAPIWHDYMDKVLGDTPIENFKSIEYKKTGKPILDGEVSGEVLVKIDKASGLLATEYTPTHMVEEKFFRQDHSILYYVQKEDPLGEAPDDPSSDPQFSLWEERIIEWAENEGYTTSSPPVDSDNVHLLENTPTVTVRSPHNNQTITEATLSASIHATAPRGINRADYYINNILVFSNSLYPFDFNSDISFLPNGFHKLSINVCDDVDNCKKEDLEFNLSLEGMWVNRLYNITWESPGNGLALTNIDFPLELVFKTENPSQISSVAVFVSIDNEATQKLTTIEAINNDTTNYFWEMPVKSGVYVLSAEAFNWQGDSKNTKDITLIINNVEKNQEEETEEDIE